MHPWRDFQFKLEYLILRALIGLVRALPMDMAVRLSARGWRVLAPLINPKRQRRAMDNLAIAFPDMPEAERHRICRAHWENLGRVMAETMHLDRIISDPSRVMIDDYRTVARYSNKLGPIIGVSLHMGNWELAIWPLAKAGKKPAAVYRSVNNPYVDSYLRAQRRDLYPGGLFGRGKVEGDHGDDGELYCHDGCADAGHTAHVGGLQAPQRADLLPQGLLPPHHFHR